jgi:Fe2+ or Zn2+ uptake regulation protein
MVEEKALVVADNIVDGKKICAKCGCSNLSWGKFDPEHGTIVKCNECGNSVAINHREFDHLSRKEIREGSGEE